VNEKENKKMTKLRPMGWPRMGMIDDLMDGSYGEMKRKAENRENLEAQNLPAARGQRTDDNKF